MGLSRLFWNFNLGAEIWGTSGPIILPRGGPGVPHISAPRSKFEKRLDSPTSYPHVTNPAKLCASMTSSLAWRVSGFENGDAHFLI